MTTRSLLFLSALSIAIPTFASAEGELRLGVGAGAGAAGYDPCAYPFQSAPCDVPRTTTAGAAPLAFAGYRHIKPLRNGWALRFGGVLSGLLVAPIADTRASVFSGAGEFGVALGRYSLDGRAGLSRVRMTYDQMSGTAMTMMFGGTATARLSSELAVFGRADAHAMMHGSAAAVFVGLGLEWTPSI